jgi:hypothetical protein
VQVYSDVQISSKSEVEAWTSSLPLPDISSELLVARQNVGLLLKIIGKTYLLAAMSSTQSLELGVRLIAAVD